jgi:hypothetical protein
MGLGKQSTRPGLGCGLEMVVLVVGCGWWSVKLSRVKLGLLCDE